jgi:CRISPR type III-B/RAMP module-associated protein Cmr5
MTLQQTMAATATETVARRAQSSDQEKKKRYRNYCESLPALLVQCGLVQTLAYLLAANQAEAGELAEDLAAHFNALHLMPAAEAAQAGNCERLLGYLQAQSVAQYRVLSSLAAQIAIWQKRMAKALLESD